MTFDGGAPKYSWVAGVLRSEIEGGTYAIGDALPPIAALAERFDISHMTAKQALGTLRSEGLISTGRGAPARVVAREQRPSVDDRIKAMNDRIAEIEIRTAQLERHVFKRTTEDDEDR
jgi:DNA-binding GntR family transcriptional regulator